MTWNWLLLCLRCPGVVRNQRDGMQVDKTAAVPWRGAAHLSSTVSRSPAAARPMTGCKPDNHATHSRVVRDANMGHQLAGGNSSCRPRLESQTTQCSPQTMDTSQREGRQQGSAASGNRFPSLPPPLHAHSSRQWAAATVVPLHSPLTLVGVSIGWERGHQQNESRAAAPRAGPVRPAPSCEPMERNMKRGEWHHA